MRRLGHYWVTAESEPRPDLALGSQADDGSRTRDLRLGKPTLYQLSYVRAGDSV
jgi:hypothetical protein